MSRFDQAMAAADANLFEVFGDEATYDDLSGTTIPGVWVVIDKNVEIMSAYDTQMPTRRNVASLRKSEVPDPKRGHKIIAGTETHIVDRLNSDDGHVLTVLLQ
mgnify:CR=1 FL=1